MPEVGVLSGVQPSLGCSEAVSGGLLLEGREVSVRLASPAARRVQEADIRKVGLDGDEQLSA